MSSQLELAKEVLCNEAKALIQASERLDQSFAEAIETLAQVNGRIVCTGLGKSGHIARKIAATLASTGSPAFFLHPSEALHGDLGMIDKGDALLAIAYGGETAEVIEVARYAKRLSLPIAVITGKKHSSLATLADFVIDAFVEKEVCPHNLAPTSSSTLTLALGDAIAICLMNSKGFKSEQFARLHPSGSLGKRLKSVHELMRKDLTKIHHDALFADTLEAMQEKNYGIIAVYSEDRSNIAGVVTDGDLRRAVRTHKENVFKITANQFMTPSAKSIQEDALALDAVTTMEKYKNTALLVEAKGTSGMTHVCGVIRMHDLIEAKLI